MPPPVDPTKPALAPGAKALDPKSLTSILSVVDQVLDNNAKNLLKFDSSRFGADWFDPAKMDQTGKKSLPVFYELMLEHNRRLASLAAMRQTVLSEAKKERDAEGRPEAAPTLNILAMAIDLYAKVFSATLTKAAMYQLLVNIPVSTSPYDPWNGWWAGPYTSEYGDAANPTRKTAYNLHIWDPSVEVNFDGTPQLVQPVTQSAATLGWFPSPNRIEQDPGIQYNFAYAINVWRPSRDGLSDGLTGYVVKALSHAAGDSNSKFTRTSMPHIAFLIERDVLIWIAVEEAAGMKPGDSLPLHMFVEKGRTDDTFPGTYVIEGASGSAKWEDADKTRFAITAGFTHSGRGTYRESLHLKDKLALVALWKLGDLKGMDANLIYEMQANI